MYILDLELLEKAKNEVSEMYLMKNLSFNMDMTEIEFVGYLIDSIFCPWQLDNTIDNYSNSVDYIKSEFCNKTECARCWLHCLSKIGEDG